MKERVGDKPYEDCKTGKNPDDWLLPDLTHDLPVASVVNQETLSKVTPVITFRETRRYMELSDVPDLPDLDDAFIEVISRL